LIAVAAVYLIGSAARARDPVLVLVLAGVVIGALLGAGVGLIKYLADPYNQLPAMTFWLLGSLPPSALPISCRCSARSRSALSRCSRCAGA
jgi:iron complex transport system permease protein